MDVKERLAKVLREHQPPTHADSKGLPRDAFDGCAEAILEVVEDMMAEQCVYPDCIRRRRHGVLSDRHLWKHAAVPPVAQGIFGSTCFMCGQYTWRRIHRKR